MTRRGKKKGYNLAVVPLIFVNPEQTGYALVRPRRRGLITNELALCLEYPAANGYASVWPQFKRLITNELVIQPGTHL